MDNDTTLVFKRDLSEGALKVANEISRYSIAFTLAYSHICQWASDPEGNTKPRGKDLDLAEVHAFRLKDTYILDKVEKLRKYWNEWDRMNTPRPPKLTHNFEGRLPTLSYGIIPQNPPIREIRVGPGISFKEGVCKIDQTGLDRELDDLLDSLDKF